MSFTTLTLDGNDYPSYATVAECDTYLSVEPSRREEWLAQSDVAKMRLVIAATRRVDALQFIGSETAADQPAAWPRMGVPGVADDVIPRRVEQACILLASTFISQPAGSEPATESVVKTIKAGSVEIQNFTRKETNLPAPTYTPVEGLELVDRRAALLLHPYVIGEGVPTKVVPGTQTPEIPVGIEYYSDGAMKGAVDPTFDYRLNLGVD